MEYSELPTENNIEFFADDIDFTLEQEKEIINWIERWVEKYQRSISYLCYIFCSDKALLNINIEHLNHDYYTDIITFPLPQPGDDRIAADIYMSIDRVRENALSLNIPFQDELHRVMIHGVLHLLGFDDHSEIDKLRMREEENKALESRNFL